MPVTTPKPATLARLFHKLGDRMADEGDKVVLRAPVLAARGWPASTNGSEGGRSTNGTSSTEHAALNPGPFDGIDDRLYEQMRLAFWLVMELHASFDRVMAHSSDDDPVPAGTGRCMVEGCDHMCNPRKNPNDRLRAGLCPRHHKRLMRMDPRPPRDWFIRYAETEELV